MKSLSQHISESLLPVNEAEANCIAVARKNNALYSINKELAKSKFDIDGFTIPKEQLDVKSIEKIYSLLSSEFSDEANSTLLGLISKKVSSSTNTTNSEELIDIAENSLDYIKQIFIILRNKSNVQKRLNLNGLYIGQDEKLSEIDANDLQNIISSANKKNKYKLELVDNSEARHPNWNIEIVNWRQ